jgi:hypothetical protein
LENKNSTRWNLFLQIDQIIKSDEIKVDKVNNTNNSIALQRCAQDGGRKNL